MALIVTAEWHNGNAVDGAPVTAYTSEGQVAGHAVWFDKAVFLTLPTNGAEVFVVVSSSGYEGSDSRHIDTWAEGTLPTEGGTELRIHVNMRLAVYNVTFSSPVHFLGPQRPYAIHAEVEDVSGNGTVYSVTNAFQGTKFWYLQANGGASPSGPGCPFLALCEGFFYLPKGGDLHVDIEGKDKPITS